MKTGLKLPNFSSIWKKYAFMIAALSLASLLISGILTMYIEIDNINNQISTDLETTLTETALSLSDPLWAYNYTSLQLLTEALTSGRTIYDIQVTDNTRGLIIDKKNPLYSALDTKIQYGKKNILKNGKVIGSIQIGIAYAPYATDLYRQLITRLIQSLVEISAFTAAILWISYTITKPLKSLETSIEAFTNGDYTHYAAIDGTDEIARLAKAFNVMAAHIDEADFELRTMNASLEQLVFERTDELMAANGELILKNSELNQALDSLHTANKEIIEATKSNLTSQLIAAVAHEINNPVGIMLTTNTFLLQEINNFNASLAAGSLKKSDLDSFMELIQEAAQNTQRNLNSAVSLLRNFKEVAVDQTSLRIRSFDLQVYLKEVISTLKPAFKYKKIDLRLECPDSLLITSYPGAYSQIFTNLILNSIKHGFKDTDEGSILIRVKQMDRKLTIDYQDDGCGLAENLLPQIFIPFFSTEHNRGGSGLGLSVVKNLIEKTLSGAITCSSAPNQGLHFSITLPLDLELNMSEIPNES